jgi:hypothetical protein
MEESRPKLLSPEIGPNLWSGSGPCDLFNLSILARGEEEATPQTAMEWFLNTGKD